MVAAGRGAGDARLLRGTQQRIIAGDGPAQGIEVGHAAAWHDVVVVLRRVGIDPAAAAGDFEGHAGEDGVLRIVVAGEDHGVVPGVRSRAARLHGPPQAVVEGARDGVGVEDRFAIDLEAGQRAAAGAGRVGARLRGVTAALQRRFDTHRAVTTAVVAVAGGRDLAVGIGSADRQRPLCVVIDEAAWLAQRVGEAGGLGVVTVIDTAAGVACRAPATALIDRGGRERTARTRVKAAVRSTDPVDALDRVAVGIVAHVTLDGGAGGTKGAIGFDGGRPARIRDGYARGHPFVVGGVLACPYMAPRVVYLAVGHLIDGVVDGAAHRLIIGGIVPLFGDPGSIGGVHRLVDQVVIARMQPQGGVVVVVVANLQRGGITRTGAF